jgi:hypothetical protein
MRQKLREHAGWIFWLAVIALAVVWNSLLVFGPPRLVVRMDWEPISLALGLLLFAIFAWYDTRSRR